MYTAAHKVKSLNLKTKKDVFGINAFIYRHREINLKDISWDEPNVALIAEQHPGILVGAKYEIPPANVVIAYLDVVAKDEKEITSIEAALKEFRKRITDHSWPRIEIIDGVGIRFGMILSEIGDELKDYDILCKHVIAILREKPLTTREPFDNSLRREEPLKVQVLINENGFEYQFDEPSLKRIQKELKGRNVKRKLKLDHVTKMNFERIYGDIIPHIIQALAGDLSLEDIIRIGGISFVNAKDKPLIEWPTK